jgi:hypothetical protein
MKHKIKLSYFKASGKYYTDGEYETEHEHMWEVFDEIKQMQAEGRLPGLVPGCRAFTIFVDASAHPVGFPALIHPMAA